MKEKLRQLLLDQLFKDLETSESIAQKRRLEAIDPGIKQEAKYDTRAIEAGYIAGAQARRLEDLKHRITEIKTIKMREFLPDQKVNLTALVTLQNEQDDAIEHYFVLPSCGGHELSFEGTVFKVVTPESLIGKKLLTCYQGDDFIIKIKGHSREFVVVTVR